MNKRTAAVLYGFYELSSDESDEFIKEVNNYINQGPIKKKEIKELTKRITLGPLSSTTSRCPCCGK